MSLKSEPRVCFSVVRESRMLRCKCPLACFVDAAGLWLFTLLIFTIAAKYKSLGDPDIADCCGCGTDHLHLMSISSFSH